MSPLDHSHVPANVIPIPNRIHPTALIAPGAKLGSDVSIGPYSIIGENVIIGQGTSIASHVTIEGWTRIGKNNQIGIGAVIGTTPQDQKFCGERSEVVIGDNNTIREYVTINRGTSGGGALTSIGNDNVFLISSHVAHDVLIGDHNVFSNGVAIGGHVVIEDWVTVGALSGLHQFVRIGSMSMVGALSLITMDVTPFALVAGNPAKRYGINVERLRRSEYSPQRRADIKKAYQILFHQGLTLQKAIEQLTAEFSSVAEMRHLIQFVEESKRGIYR